MGTVLEGILCACSRDEMKAVYNNISSPPLSLVVGEINSSLFIVFRASRYFSQETDAIASYISTILNKALVIRYDDRVGHRTSALYENGRLVITFGENDEIWVMLDDDGNPIIDGSKFTAVQVDAVIKSGDVEFETIRNSIELGLEAFGHGNWEEVFDFIGVGEAIVLE